jgi:hypothetical protein
MITWGVGSIPLNMQAKVECDKDLAIVIWKTQISYAKALKGAWKNVSLQMVWCRVILHNTMNKKWFMVNKF